ncbi:hypothetical protein OAS37_07430 [Alphaproteobacteria bacterium]|nr:hypothetical protein [Alphaproteobacteria bacterium]
MIKIKKQHFLTICVFLWWIFSFVFFVIIVNEIPSLNFISQYLFGTENGYIISFGVYLGGGCLLGLISNFKYDNECPMIQFQLMFVLGLIGSIVMLLSPLFGWNN